MSYTYLAQETEIKVENSHDNAWDAIKSDFFDGHFPGAVLTGMAVMMEEILQFQEKQESSIDER